MDINWRRVTVAAMLTAVAVSVVITMALNAARIVFSDDQPDTTPCRTDVATMIQQDGPKTWPQSCAGLSTDQQDRVSAAVVRDLLNG